MDRKKYFLGNSKKIDSSIAEGTTIDPYNNTFFSKVLFDKKNRPYRIKGKGDAIIKFKDGSCGIIDYKTSKLKKIQINQILLNLRIFKKK